MTTSSRSGDGLDPTVNNTDLTRRDLLTMAAAGAAAAVPGASFAAGPRGQLTWAIHVSLAPTWFDPADTQAVITPFMVLYALHDAVVKPMPGNVQAPSLAEVVVHLRGLPQSMSSCCAKGSGSTMARR